MIEIRRLGAQIGAEIRGVDVKTLDDAGFAAIYRAWLDCNVVVVPGQDLQIEDFLRYSRRFGVVHPHPSKMTRHPDYPEITLLGVNKFGPDGALDMADLSARRRGLAHRRRLRPGAVQGDAALRARRAEHAAATRCSPACTRPTTRCRRGSKQRLEGRSGAFTYGGRRKATALLNAEDRDWTPVFHPIIRTHPETGRKALYFDPGKILRIEGLDESESDALIEELTALHDPARRPVPSPVAQGRHRHLGQPLLVSQGGGRLPAGGRPHPLARLDQGAPRGRRARRLRTSHQGARGGGPLVS